MLFGLRSARAGDKSAAFRWTMITAALGIIFGLLHIREWFGLIGEGMTMFDPLGHRPVRSLVLQYYGPASYPRCKWCNRIARRQPPL